MRTVLIIGAGGSLAHAQDLRPKRTGSHPPLDRTFFDRCEQMARTDDEVRRRVNALKKAIADSGIFVDPWFGVRPPMEQFFADVYYEVASETHSAFEAFVELLHLYAVVLSTTTNWMACRTRQGELGKWIRRELDRAGDDGVTIITFNQDLVIENELGALPQRYGSLVLRSLYGNASLEPLWAHSAFPAARRFDLLGTHATRPPHSCRLLKLHGSLNWMLRTRARNPEPGTLFPRRSGNRQVFVLDRREINDGQMMTTDAGAGRERWYLWPLVVPPIYDKQRITGMNVLRSVWDEARIALETCERVVMYGYSLPDADVLARQLLRRAFVSNSSLDAVDVVNPDVSLVNKINAALGPSVVRWYDNLSSLIRHT